MLARVTSDGQTRASTTSPLKSQTSHLRDLRQTGCDVMSVLVSQEADVLLANLAYRHDRSVGGSSSKKLERCGISVSEDASTVHDRRHAPLLYRDCRLGWHGYDCYDYYFAFLRIDGIHFLCG